MNFKQLRKESELTLEEIAKALGVSKQIVSAWEQGIKPIPESRCLQLNTVFTHPERYRIYRVEMSLDEYKMFLKLIRK
jgi:DNA-binding transcriptional regulator YiaG